MVKATGPGQCGGLDRLGPHSRHVQRGSPIVLASALPMSTSTTANSGKWWPGNPPAFPNRRPWRECERAPRRGARPCARSDPRQDGRLLPRTPGLLDVEEGAQPAVERGGFRRELVWPQGLQNNSSLVAPRRMARRM